ncbi:HNH endonuclease [Sphaerisporangium album]|uniref:HNH endonuclease n=1 Tax=Sphaerisporangium album TaxID=509200 RepID=A0A367FQM1_9ACTN|nr:HNH endonuclease family protein [Sphaerisporangium album]RCG32007.1 HNH endonuclease [Sphaerisporangium album]
MPFTPPRRTAALLYLTVVLLAGSAAAPASASPPSLPEPSPAATAQVELAELAVDEPHAMTGYSRAKFPHWAEQGGACSTREVVLERDGAGVQRDAECRAVSGTWHSEYDGKTLTAAAQVDIDHMVPLANAWRSGADAWSTAKRRDFANDLTNPQLIAVSAASNRAKGDQNPADWKPPLRSYWCTYARAWTDVKYRYGLAVTAAEKTALDQMLDTCPGRQHP